MVQVPGVAGRLKGRGPVRATQGKLVHRQLAQQNASSLLQSGRGGRVFRGNPLDVHAGAGCGAYAGGVVQVLQGEGDAVHWAAVFAAQHFGLGDPGLLQGLVGQQQDERVQSVVGVGDAVQAGASQFDGRQFAPAHQLTRLVDGQKIKALVSGCHG